MTKNNDQKDIHSFDLKYLKAVTDDLQDEVRKRGVVMGKMETHMATTTLILKQLRDKDDEQDNALKEHGLRIHTVEMAQAGCQAPTKVRQHDRELKRLNAFMDFVKQGTNNEIDTGVVDTHAERMQAAAEAAIVNSLPIKLHLAKSWPIIILVAIFCIVVTTLIMARVFTGIDIQIPTVNDIPGVNVKTNSSSHEGQK